MGTTTTASIHRGSPARARLARALCACALLASGCYKATFVQPKTAAGIEYEEWTDFFVFGLAGEEERNIADYCRGEVARVRTGGNFATGLVSAVTLGIYTPRKVYVTCADAESTRALAASSEEQAP